MEVVGDPRHLVPVRAHLLLRAGDRLLLTRRAPDLPGGGRWQPPGGHLEPGESVLDCAVREAREEVGVDVAGCDLRFVHARHVLVPGGDSRMVLLFETTRWRGEPANREPLRCDAIGFFRLGALPQPLVGHLAQAIAGYLRGEPFGVSRRVGGG